jgi:hypothetical protein
MAVKSPVCDFAGALESFGSGSGHSADHIALGMTVMAAHSSPFPPLLGVGSCSGLQLLLRRRQRAPQRRLPVSTIRVVWGAVR